MNCRSAVNLALLPLVAAPPADESGGGVRDPRRKAGRFNRETFHSVVEARVLYFDWCDVCNNFRPHSSITYLAPAMYAALLLSQPPSPALGRDDRSKTASGDEVRKKRRAEQP
jgi:hypothetical protein